VALGLSEVAPPLVRMRLAGFRHTLADPEKSSWVWTGAAIGVLLAAGTIWAGAADPDLLAVALAVWMLGWAVGPLFAGGGDETLRPEYFTMLPLRSRTLAGGLLAAAFAGIAPLVSLLALTGLVVLGARLSLLAAIIAVPAALLQLVSFVLVSRLAVAVYSVLLRYRSGAILAAVVNAFVLAFTAQGWALIAAYVSSDVQGTMASSARISPSGWGISAVESAGRGEWWRVLLALAGLAVLSYLMYVAWAALLVRRTTASRSGVRPRYRLAAKTPLGAATGKELRTWSRDLLTGHRLAFAVGYALFFCLMPLAVGWTGMLPWTGPIAVLMAGAISANLYGSDGTALWLTLATPKAAAVDVRARQLAFLLVVTPPAVLLTVLLTWWSDRPDSWPVVLAVLPALLGGAAGLGVLLSAASAVPAPDPHQRSGNVLASGGDDGQLVGQVYAMLVATATVAVPALVVALFWSWWGLPVGLASGVLAWWWFGLLAARRLETQGPELLALLRRGRTVRSPVRRPTASRASRFVVNTCTTLGIIALVPQGIVPAVFKISGTDAKAWFLALYVPEPWQWVVIAGMVLLGLTLLATAFIVYRRTRPAGTPAAQPGLRPGTA
jgi:ABC-2 type transport system permease protein